MRTKSSLTISILGLGLAGILGTASAAEVTDAQQAAKIAKGQYPGKVVATTKTTSDEGKPQYSVEVHSGIYQRRVIVDADNGEIHKIYYRRNGQSAWIAKKVPMLHIVDKANK